MRLHNKTYTGNVEDKNISTCSKSQPIPLMRLGQLAQRMQRESHLPRASSIEIIRNFLNGIAQIRSEGM